MFAVLRTGGKQYRVTPEDVIQVERLTAEAGESIELDDVLAIGDGDAVSLGQPVLEGARVAATVVEHTRGKKILVFRKKRRKNYRRKRGHRQDLTLLRIDEILAAGEKRKPAKVAAKAKADAPAKAKAASKPKSKDGAAAKPKAKAASAKPKAASAKPKAAAAKPKAKAEKPDEAEAKPAETESSEEKS
jgi:large subunit ribosomal protein L21